MASITLKALSPSLHRALKTRAAQHKRSLNQEVISVLEAAVAPSQEMDIEARIAHGRRFRESIHLVTTSEEIDAFKKDGRE